MLSVTDYRLIQQQCENQHATQPRDFIGMTAAYIDGIQSLLFTKHESITPSYLTALIKTWGHMVDDCNVNGWRHVPVQVSGNFSVPPEHIDSQMKSLTGVLVSGGDRHLTPTGAYEAFENIHPFIDGNGRVGHVLWAWYTAYLGGQWPQTLPPDVFNQGIEGAARPEGSG